MPENTVTPEIVWDDDVAMLADPDLHPCDNPFDWQPIELDDVPVGDDQ